MRSLWDRDGGHVFVEGSRATASVVYLALLLGQPFGKQVFHSGEVRKAYRLFTADHHSYGTPSFDAAEARSRIGSTLTETSETQVESIDDETVERLENMGYL